MKRNNLLTILLMSAFLFGCKGNETDKVSFISEIKKTESGKTYYSLDSKAVTPIGVQIRTDLLLYEEKLDFSEIEKRLELAKNLGVSLVEIPMTWKHCEPNKDQYNFRDLGKILNKAYELDLKVELLTFGANTTGWSNYVPTYIENDDESYPRYQSNSTTGLFLVQDNPNLLDREGKWIDAMMSSIKIFSDNHNNAHVVSAIQIHNESDTFPRFVLSQQGIKTVDGKRKLTDIEAWKETLSAYNYLGGMVKKSEYPCITRANVAQAYKDSSYASFVGDIFNLENIDIVGDDTYEQTVAFNKNVILDFNSDDVFKGNNFPHISENDGSYTTTPSLILATTALGGGYMIYDLATPEIALDSYGWSDWGILNPRTLEDKEHTSLTRNIIKGISLAKDKYVLADKENIAAFNLKTNLPEENLTQSIQTTHALITFKTNTKSLAYAITSEKEIYLYSTGDSSFEFSNVELECASIGTIDFNGEFHTEEKAALKGNTINVSGEKLYRIKVNKVDSKLVSNTVRSIG
ncbi:MAG: DUF4978 domain-containing protein [Candidatus Enteromonas sp.]|nr:DUF4978 domain-containing protein [Candidatus Enteromonas sp.]